MQNQTTNATKTKEELVRAMQREFTEIESIMENIKELKEEAKSAGYDATMLAKLAKAMAEAKTDDLIEKSQAFIDLADEVRGV